MLAPRLLVRCPSYVIVACKCAVCSLCLVEVGIQPLVKSQCVEGSSTGTRVQAKSGQVYSAPRVCPPHVLARCAVCSSANVCRRAICTVLLDGCSRSGKSGQVNNVPRVCRRMCLHCVRSVIRSRLLLF